MAVEIPYKTDRSPETKIVDFNGAKFKTVFWDIPEDVEYAGRIVYVHGFCEHSSIYTEFFDKLSKKGYQIFFFDQRGAGETSPGSEMGKTHEKHVFDDLDYMIQLNLKQLKSSEEKLILMGHSMGGGIALNYAIRGKYRDNIRCIVVSAPLVLLHPNTKPNPIVKSVASFASKLMPNFRIDTKLNYDYITSNEEWKNYIKSHDKKLLGSLKQIKDMLDRGEKLLDPDHASKFNPQTSVMILHGTEDNINWFDGSKKFIDTLPANIDKKFTPIKGAKHSLFIEREELFNEIFEKVTEFLAAH